MMCGEKGSEAEQLCKVNQDNSFLMCKLKSCSHLLCFLHSMSIVYLLPWVSLGFHRNPPGSGLAPWEGKEAQLSMALQT